MGFDMKEYLRKNSNGGYSYIGHAHVDHVDDLLIEIPEGADIAIKFKDGPDGFGVIFYKNNGKSCFSQNDKAWKNDADWTMKDLLNENYCEDGIDFSHDILWQRSESPNDKLASAEQYRQAEVLPFIDDEPKNVKQGSIEQTLAQRQSQYGCFEDVAFVTQGMIELMRKCNYDKMPAPHQMALSMICSKVARIVNGDFNFIENWHDISGYATLVENKLMVTDGAKNSRLVYQKVIDGKLQDI